MVFNTINQFTSRNIDDDEAIRQFKKTQEHDRMKNLYAAESGYPLLRLDIKHTNYFKELTTNFLDKYLFKKVCPI